MYSPTKSLSARISQRLLLGMTLAGLIATDIQIPTVTSAAALTRENTSLQTQSSSTKTLSPTAKSSSAGSRKSHRLVRRPAPSSRSETGAISTATLNQAPLTTAINTLPAKTVSPELGTTSTREAAPEKQSPPISFAAPIAGPLALMQTAPVATAAASPSTLMGSAQPSTRVAAAAPSGARGPNLPGRMQRLLSELPGAAQIVAYQEEDPDPTVIIPTLTRNPSVLSFSAVQNGSSPAAQSLTITNTGPGVLTWTASSNSAWLTLNNTTSASGTNLGSVSVRVNPAGLSVGTHSGLITIVGAGSANSPQTVSVSFDVTAAPTPTIGLSATTLSFSAIQGGSNPANKTISISNSGSGNLSWTATGNASWLSLSPAAGTGAGTISVSINTTGMTPGTVNGQITITASGATNTPQTVMVSATITAASAPPAIGITPGGLTFTAQQGGANPAPQSLTIRNTGGGTLTWTVSNSATWLSHSPTSGTGTGVVTISPTIGSLTAGTYNGSVTLYAAGATAINVPITLTITPAPQPTTGSITLSWNANSEADLAGYKVYRATSSGGYGAPVATLTAGTIQYISNGLAKGVTYFFVITAYDQAGNESPYSVEASKSVY